MYSQRARRLPDTPGSAIPFENKALLDAVRLISGSLVKRAGISSRDAAYANLLSDIWGQSQYATIEILAAKRKNARGKKSRKPQDVGKQKQQRLPESFSAYEKAEDEQAAEIDAAKRKEQRINSARDKLVTLLRCVKEDSVAANERRLTRILVAKEGPLDFDAIRRLWGVPQAAVEVSKLDTYLCENSNLESVSKFYDQHIFRASPDARVFNVLYWGEHRSTGAEKQSTKSVVRSISKDTVALVVRVLLTKRKSPFFEKNMDTVIETVLYGINPDKYIHRIRECELREAGFHRGLQGYEHSRSFTAALENLQLGKLNRMLKDIRAVKGLDEDLQKAPDNLKLLSLRAVSRYCAERDTLTERALHGVYGRYVQRNTSFRNGECTDQRIAEADFVRMYLALVGSGTDPALKYWFSILDQDGDGWVGAGDVAHFYSERRMESEKRNGIMLADVRCLWIRLCAMIGVSANGKGLDFHSLKDLGREDREFIMCALLIRRADDGNLINVAATVSSEADHSLAL